MLNFKEVLSTFFPPKGHSCPALQSSETCCSRSCLGSASPRTEGPGTRPTPTICSPLSPSLLSPRQPLHSHLILGADGRQPPEGASHPLLNPGWGWCSEGPSVTKGMLCPQGLALTTKAAQLPQGRLPRKPSQPRGEKGERRALQVTQTRARAHRAEARRPHGPCCATQAPGCPQVCHPGDSAV